LKRIKSARFFTTPRKGSRYESKGNLLNIRNSKEYLFVVTRFLQYKASLIELLCGPKRGERETKRRKGGSKNISLKIRSVRFLFPFAIPLIPLEGISVDEKKKLLRFSSSPPSLIVLSCQSDTLVHPRISQPPWQAIQYLSLFQHLVQSPVVPRNITELLNQRRNAFINFV